MAYTASLLSPFTFSSFSAHFIASPSPIHGPRSPPSRVRLHPLHVSAACSATSERTPSHSCIASPVSLYEILGIQTGATFQEIKAAYRRLARVLHPDVATNCQKEETTCQFIKIHEAYETLSDPDKRAHYDRSLYWPAATEMGRSSAFWYTTRNWETDQCW